MENLTQLQTGISIIMITALMFIVMLMQAYPKYRTAFNLGLGSCIFFALSGLVFNMRYFYAVSFVFGMLLPACNKKN